MCVVAFSCFRVPLPSFPWPIQNILRNAQPLELFSDNIGPNVVPKRQSTWNSGRSGGNSNDFVAVRCSGLVQLYCVRLVIARSGFLCVYFAAFGGFALIASSNMTLVLLCVMVRVKRRVGTAVLLLPRKVAARLPECVAVVEFARLKQSTIEICQTTRR